MLRDLIKDKNALEAQLAKYNVHKEDENSDYWYLRYKLSECQCNIADIYAKRKLYLYAVKYYYQAYELTQLKRAEDKLNIHSHRLANENTVPKELPNLSGEEFFYRGLQAQAGLGVPINHSLASYYYQAAALEGDYLPAYYAFGHNNVINGSDRFELKLKMHTEAAERGHTLAQYDLGVIHVHTIPDQNKADRYQISALAKGCALSQQMFGMNYLNENNDLAVSFLLSSAMQGLAYSAQQLIRYVKKRDTNKTPSNADICQKILNHYRYILKKYNSKLAKKYIIEIYYNVKIIPSPDDARAYCLEACKYGLIEAEGMLKNCYERNQNNQDVKYYHAISMFLSLNNSDYNLLTELFRATPSDLIKRISTDTLLSHTQREKILEYFLSKNDIAFDAHQQSEIAYLRGNYQYDQLCKWFATSENKTNDEIDRGARVIINETLSHLMKVSPDSPHYLDAADLITLIRGTLLGENYQDLCFTFFTQKNKMHPMQIAYEEMQASICRP